jgi:hypothetical protein
VPRPPSDTARGSQVGLQKRKRAAAWRSLLESKARAPGLSLRLLARQAQMSHNSAAKRWKAYESARDAGASESAALESASGDARGGHNRALSLDQQQLLRDQILAAPAANGTTIRLAALELKQAVSEAHEEHRHALRAAPPAFKASPSFVRRFKKNNRLSSRRTKMQQVSRHAAAAAPRDESAESLDFLTECQDALLRFGPHLLLNMDETPCKLADLPTTALRETGSKEAAKIEVGSNQQYLNITTFPCISAAGDKLPLGAILKGKTERSLLKVRNGASATTQKVQLYFSESGWMNGGLLVR